MQAIAVVAAKVFGSAGPMWAMPLRRRITLTKLDDSVGAPPGCSPDYRVSPLQRTGSINSTNAVGKASSTCDASRAGRARYLGNFCVAAHNSNRLLGAVALLVQVLLPLQLEPLPNSPSSCREKCAACGRDFDHERNSVGPITCPLTNPACCQRLHQDGRTPARHHWRSSTQEWWPIATPPSQTFGHGQRNPCVRKSSCFHASCYSRSPPRGEPLDQPAQIVWAGPRVKLAAVSHDDNFPSAPASIACSVSANSELLLYKPFGVFLPTHNTAAREIFDRPGRRQRAQLRRPFFG